ncbi:MAG: putative DNA-binding domain-containing protein [Porticoccaceae bacterium]
MSGSPDTLRLRDYQLAFAARIRDPRGQPRPQGIPARRMRVYETLLFNNLNGFLLACFPVARRLLGVRAWRKLVRQFFVEQRCASPLFRDIPGAFLDWMQEVAPQTFPDRPWLYELMHYEWLELAVMTDAAEVEAVTDDGQEDLLAGVPLLNATARLACYRYPVHRIGPRFKATGTEGADGASHCYLLYRDDRDVVRFRMLNPVSARLLALIDAEGLSGRDALYKVAAELGHAQSETVVETGAMLLADLRRAGALTGVRSRHA